MLFEIRNGGFINKGAELMLLSSIYKVREEFPYARLAVIPGDDDFEKRSQLSLFQKIWLNKYGIQWGRLAGAIPSKILNRYGMVLDNKIDVVLDISGFAYSDQCSEFNTLNMARCVKEWKKQGTKVILLPQALGPFNNPKIKNAFRFILDNVDLVFPRDEISYQHVLSLSGERANVFQAPDFTNILEGIILPDNFEKYSNKYCLVPNYRMIEKTTDKTGKQYIDFCVHCIQSLIDHGESVLILIHEGEKDVSLTKSILKKIEQEIEVVLESDALKIKGIIGCCKGVISSRFHALVSALSQGVPALSTGWSHKYEELFNEYGIPNGCLATDLSEGQIDRIIKETIDPENRKNTILRINKSALDYKQKTSDMWEKVFAVLK